ncbi:serine/threonine-protein kinase [Deinococcus aquiradiocola]|nr:serine/threonine-protein kinase [Deinococcus aquiradiocola]
MTLTPHTLTVEASTPLGYRGGVEHLRARWQDQPVFIKQLGSRDPEQQERFAHEGFIARRLAHPLLVPLLAHSPQQLVFPYVDGCTLRDLIEEGPLDPAAAVRVTLGLLDVVTYLHAQGVTHHDLKPENVMLQDREQAAHAVRLIDLGMAHDRHATSDTHAGTRMGTPHFMAPEQFQGVRGDPRSDVYALGVLLWDAIAGHPPYADPLCWLIGRPATRDPLPGPAALHPILDRCLQHSPADRYASVMDLAAALNAVPL